MKRLLALAFMLSSATAVAQQAQMANISAIGVADGVDPHIACTIVIDSIELAVLAEAVTQETDVFLELCFLEDGGRNCVDTNDDWTDISINNQNTLIDDLRLPNLVTDSASVGLVSPAIGSSIRSVCAYAYERRIDGPAGLINLQLNNLDAIRALSRSATTKTLNLKEFKVSDDQSKFRSNNLPIDMHKMLP